MCMTVDTSFTCESVVYVVYHTGEAATTTTASTTITGPAATRTTTAATATNMIQLSTQPDLQQRSYIARLILYATSYRRN